MMFFFKLLFSIFFFILIIIYILFFAPKTLLGNKVSKYLNIINKNQSLEALISLYEAIIYRFHNPIAVPIIVLVVRNYSNPLDLLKKEQEAEALDFTNEKHSWFLTNKMAIFTSEEKNLQEVLHLVKDVFSQSFSSILFLLSFNEANNILIESWINLINNISGKTPLFFAFDYTDMSHNFNSNEPFVFLDTKSLNHNNIDAIIYNFQDELIKQLISNNLGDLVINDILNLNWSILLKKSISDFTTSGFFIFSSYPNSYLLEVLNHVYFSCENIAANNLQDKLKNYSNIIIFLISTIVFLFTIINRLSNIYKIQDSITSNYDGIKAVNVLAHTSANKNFSIGATAICSKETKFLKSKSTILAQKASKIFTNIKFLEIKETFCFSPVNTAFFSQLNQNTKELINHFNTFYNFIKSEGLENNLEEPLEKYIELFKTQTINNFSSFVKLWQEHVFYKKLQELNISLNNLASNRNLNMENLRETIFILQDLKKHSGLTENEWWLKQDLGTQYRNLLQDIGAIEKIGPKLKEEINSIIENSLRLHKDDILASDHLLTNGSYFLLDGQIRFTSNLESFLNLLIQITREPSLQFNTTKVKPKIAIEQEIILWDLDKLDRILFELKEGENFILSKKNEPAAIRTLLSTVSYNQMKDFIINRLYESAQISAMVKPIEEKATNLNIAIEKIEQIQNFSQNILKQPLLFIDPILSDSITKIFQEFKIDLNKKLFTNYRNLSNWRGEDLISYLFQCNPEDLSFIVSSIIQNLEVKNTKVLSLILAKPMLIDRPSYEFAQSISQQIKAYEKQDSSSLAEFSRFILSLKEWNLAWKKPIEPITSQQDWFRYHHKAFEAALINKTNQLVLEKNVERWNELQKFFQDKLQHKFPFNNNLNTESVKLEDLIYFLNSYSKYKAFFYSDNEFLQLPQAKDLVFLDSLLSFFEIGNNKIFMKIFMNCHASPSADSSKNNNLIISYSSQFGSTRRQEESFLELVNIEDPFSLAIEIANSSVMKLMSFPHGRVSNNRVLFEFQDKFSFLRFANKFYNRYEKGSLWLKILFPILNSENKKEIDNIICFIKLDEFPDFGCNLKKIILNKIIS